MNRAEIAALARYGIHLPEVVGLTSDLAMDAQVALVTQSNAGIPAYLANYVDPGFIEILTTPNKAAKIAGETKKGDWTSRTLTFPVVEYTGEVSSYGDYNNNGSTGVNPTFPQRQPYHYQTFTQWGEQQLEIAGLAKLDYAAQMNQASANVLNKFQNDTYFFGVAGLQNYGLINDPALSASITPGGKAFNSGSSGPWITAGVVTATANEIFADIQAIFSKLVAQCSNLIDAESKMVLGMPPGSAVALLTTNQYNVNVNDMLKKNFPNLRVETAAQYAQAGGNLVQLIVENIEGQDVVTTVYTEKMRAHRIVADTSSWKQKKSQGSAGTVYYRPMGAASMLGV
jgi:hypothetical protein